MCADIAASSGARCPDRRHPHEVTLDQTQRIPESGTNVWRSRNSSTRASAGGETSHSHGSVRSDWRDHQVVEPRSGVLRARRACANRGRVGGCLDRDHVLGRTAGRGDGPLKECHGCRQIARLRQPTIEHLARQVDATVEVVPRAQDLDVRRRTQKELGVLTCTACGRTMPLTAVVPIKQSRDAYYGRCRACRAEVARERYRADPQGERLRSSARSAIVASDCKAAEPRSSAHHSACSLAHMPENAKIERRHMPSSTEGCTRLAISRTRQLLNATIRSRKIWSPTQQFGGVSEPVADLDVRKNYLANQFGRHPPPVSNLLALPTQADRTFGWTSSTDELF